MTAAGWPGYGFVDFPDRVRRVERPHARLDRRTDGTWSGEMTLVLLAEQPVHVGAGAKAVEAGTVVRKGALVRGRPGIPGSTLKGVLRSRFEAITRSCAPSPPPFPVSSPSRTHGAKSKARLSSNLKQEDWFKDVFSNQCNRRGPACPACGLFGCLRQRGRVTVLDFAVDGDTPFTIEKMPSQFAPRLHHVGAASPMPDHHGGGGGRLLEVTSLHGRKFAVGQGPVVEAAGFQAVETIPTGARVRGSLRLWSVTAEELGGLLAALGRLPASTVKVGAGKGHRFGRMRVVETGFRWAQAGRGTSAEDAWRAAFEASEDRFAAGQAQLTALQQEDV